MLTERFRSPVSIPNHEGKSIVVEKILIHIFNPACSLTVKALQCECRYEVSITSTLINETQHFKWAGKIMKEVVLLKIS